MPWSRLWEVPHFPSRIAERGKCKHMWKLHHVRKMRSGGREKNERPQKKPNLLTLCIALTKYDSGYLFHGSLLTSVKKSTGHCQHSTKSQFLSMSDKLQVCLEKICLITSLKKEQTQAVKPCWKGEMYLGYFQPDLGKVLSRVQHSTNICKHKHPHYFST